MGEATMRKELEKFVDKFLACYEKRYLEYDLQDAVKRNEQVHGIPGLLGSLDCTHVRWDMCPKAHHGSFRGRSGHPSIILEAIADADRKIVHWYWGARSECFELEHTYG